jgi:IS5 family transposase
LVLPVRVGSAPLDDPVFFARFAAYFDARIGCPSIPVETYLRLMFLKFGTGWAMSRCAGRWPIPFPGNGFARSTSAPTTVMKITTRYGDDAVAGLNEALLRPAKAAAANLLRTEDPRRHHRGGH